MWICRQCNAQWKFTQVVPAIDNNGCHFICPTCNNRNVLVNVSKDEDKTELTQLDS